ncbi:glioma pathogenesis-related protein 1b isoform X1 [Rhinichthys klamathensis goyatoka]|uniref:glioma pathogenesis-related protein 1b isoform X1 n=1 Tax=Rhinichthys klamathensis goyatoka TaxID=3034132 RepID=UPI0024B5C03F|nr:glioma pathogenesis-related protein 1b isoform X1 [Rhinichthys klamathensis goyatoka]
MDSLGSLLLQIWVLLYGSFGVLALLPGITEPEFIRRCVQAHNTQRSRVTPPAVSARSMVRQVFRVQSWDNELAKGARDRARHCKASHHPGLGYFGHPPFGWMGENIWLGAPFAAFSVENAIHRWNKEGVYSLKNNNCSRLCGHYTQLMWSTSFKLGCAVNVCSKGIENFSTHPESTIFVCNYGDTGQVHGVTPNIAGVGCSGCGSEICRDNVCRYDWFPGWDHGPPSSAPSVSYWLTNLGLCLLGVCWHFYVTH